MADVKQNTFLGTGAETEDESTSLIKDAVTSTIVNFSPSGNEAKEDCISIYSPTSENKGDFSAAVASNQITQSTDSTNDQEKMDAEFNRNVTATSNAANDIAQLTSQNSQVNSIKPSETLSESEERLTETVTALKVDDANVDEERSDETVGGGNTCYVIGDDVSSDVTGAVFTSGVAGCVDDVADTSLEASSEVKDESDDSFEKIEESEQPLSDQIGLTKTVQLGGIELNEKNKNEEIEFVLSREAEEALSKAMEQVLTEGRDKLLTEPNEQISSETSEQSPLVPIEQFTSGRSEQLTSETIETTIGENIETSLNNELAQTGNDKQKLAIYEEQELVLNETQEPVLNDAQIPVLNETHELKLNDAQEPLLNEAQEQVLNEAQEPVLNEVQEPMLNDAQESLLHETQEPVLNEAHEQVLNETQEPVLNEAHAEAITKALEQVLNEAREQLLNETRENSLNDTSSISLTGCDLKLRLSENETGQRDGKDKRKEESSHEIPSRQGSEHVLETPTNLNQASSIQTTELTSHETLETGKLVASEHVAGLSGHDRVDEDIVVPLVSASRSTTEGLCSEHAINQPVKTESKATCQDVEILKSVTTEIDHRSTLPSQINLDEDIDEGMSLTSSTVAEEIEHEASDKDDTRCEVHRLAADSEFVERTSLKCNITMENISVGNPITRYPRGEDFDAQISSSDHREEGNRHLSSDDRRDVCDTSQLSDDNRNEGDTPTSSDDNRNGDDKATSPDDNRIGGDKPTSFDDNREVHIDKKDDTSKHRTGAVEHLDIPTSTSQEQEDKNRSPIKLEAAPENQKPCDATEKNAENTSPSQSHPIKADRIVCLTVLKLTAVALTGFGCAVAAPFALAAFGFEAGGIAAGSVAAGIMSAASDAGVGLSIISFLEAVGMTGLGLGAQVLIGAAGAGTAGGVLAAVELLKSKSTQEEALRADRSTEQAGGDSDEHYNGDEADNNEGDESESNGDYSIEEDTAGDTSDDASAEIQDDVRLSEEDFGESDKDGNYPRAESTEREDEFENDDSVKGTQETCAGSRHEDQFTSEMVIEGQEVINIELRNDRLSERSALQDVMYDVTGVEENPTAVIGEGRSELIEDDLPVNPGKNFQKVIEDYDKPENSIIGGDKVTHLEGGEDDHTDNPWKDEDCTDTTY